MVNCFFFSSRRRHTRYWRDWSSDVCSSDLRRSGGSDRVWRLLPSTERRPLHLPGCPRAGPGVRRPYRIHAPHRPEVRQGVQNLLYDVGYLQKSYPFFEERVHGHLVGSVERYWVGAPGAPHLDCQRQAPERVVARLFEGPGGAIERYCLCAHVQDRKSVVEGKSVDLGGRRIIKKKKYN